MEGSQPVAQALTWFNAGSIVWGRPDSRRRDLCDNR